jgi:hypothetical protein
MKTALSRTLILCLVGWALPVAAQEKSAPVAPQDSPPIAHSFDELRARLKVKQFIYVTDQHGQRTRARFKGVTAETLVVTVFKAFSPERSLAFTEQEVALVKARRGWAKKGMLMGLIAGAAVGIIPGSRMDSDITGRGGTMGFLVLFSGAMGAAVGGLTGAVLDRPRVVFEHAAR